MYDLTEIKFEVIETIGSNLKNVLNNFAEHHPNHHVCSLTQSSAANGQGMVITTVIIAYRDKKHDQK